MSKQKFVNEFEQATINDGRKSPSSSAHHPTLYSRERKLGIRGQVTMLSKHGREQRRMERCSNGSGHTSFGPAPSSYCVYSHSSRVTLTSLQIFNKDKGKCRASQIET